MKINAELGGRILDAFEGVKVDVHNPDVEINVEIRNHINIYSKIIPGPGGMPVGTAGKAMLLLSGGIDSPVAGWMTAKRGVVVDAVYFHAPPYTSERAKQKVVDLAKLVSKYSGPMRLYVVNFTEIQMYIYDKCPHDELTIIMRRYMMKIAEYLQTRKRHRDLLQANRLVRLQARQCSHLLQQTRCAICLYTDLSLPWTRMISIDISNKIDTYETSILPYEDCCTIFVAKHPVTKPNINRIKKSEERLNDVIDELMKTAIDTTEVIMVDAE